MLTFTLPLSLVYLRDDGRAVREDRIAPLAESIKTIGLKTPITVRPCQRIKDGQLIDAYEIVAGQHRYHAALKLQWQEIECFVTDDDELHAELWEIDENLMRAELSPAEEAVFLKRRKEIWAALHPSETGKTFPSLGGRGNKEFAAETAEKSARTKRSINQSIHRAEQLGDDIDKVKGTTLDKGVELDALVKMQPKEREKLIERAASGEKVSARAVLEKKIAPKEESAKKPEPPDPSSAENQKVTAEELKKIRQLDDFDLIMLISEIHDHGWQTARKTLEMMPVAA